MVASVVKAGLSESRPWPIHATDAVMTCCFFSARKAGEFSVEGECVAHRAQPICELWFEVRFWLMPVTASMRCVLRRIWYWHGGRDLVMDYSQDH